MKMHTPVMAQLTQDVQRCAAALREGRLVAFATETVYGLGANALDPLAVAKVFEAKQRPHFDPLIVHIGELSQLSLLVTSVPEVAQKLIDAFWPGPLTLVLPKQPCVPDLVTSGLPDVAVRMPDHPLALELLRQTRLPIAAPSANPFGRISPTKSAHVMESLGDCIDYVLDGGPCRVGVESTVLQVFPEGPVHARLLRPGGITREELEAVIGRVEVGSAANTGSHAQVAPGMLSQHYAPRTPLQIIDDWQTVRSGAQVAALAFEEIPHPERFGHVRILSREGSLPQAATRFFNDLRELDATDAELIVASRFPQTGLGIALNDRLQRAAAKP